MLFVKFALQKDILYNPGVGVFLPKKLTSDRPAPSFCDECVASHPAFDSLFLDVYNTDDSTLFGSYVMSNSCHGNYSATYQYHFIGMDSILGDAYIDSFPTRAAYAIRYGIGGGAVIVKFAHIGPTAMTINGKTSIQIATPHVQHLDPDTGVVLTNVNGANPYAFTSPAEFPESERCMHNPGVPLPVTLMHFDALVLEGPRVKVEFATASEENNAFFEVHRSLDGKTSEVIGIVSGAGNSNCVRKYSFIDEAPYAGLSYYWLRQVDHNGQSSSSNIVRVRIAASPVSAYAYPNPTAQSTLNLKVTSTQHLSLYIEMQSMLGQNVMDRQSYDLTAGSQTLSLPMRTVSNGMYVLFIRDATTGEILQKERIVVRK